jgi:DNA-binding Lrp family transcriptional regulator
MAVLAYVLFKVSSGSERDADILFGEYDVVAKVETPELYKLEEFISIKVRNVPSVLVTTTMIVSREYKGKNHILKTK